MKLHRVINATFPRSGHHMMANVLSYYFGDNFKYCEWYSEPDKRPHICPETNFTKTHDFNLQWPITNDFKYLVLIRHPIYSLASWRHHLETEEGEVTGDMLNTVAKEKLKFWCDFICKWVLPPIPNRMIVEYETLISEPLRCFEPIVRFMGDDEPDLRSLRDCITRADIKRDKPNTTKDWIGFI